MSGKIVVIVLSYFVSVEIMGMDEREYDKKRQIIDETYAKKLEKYITSDKKCHYTQELVRFKEKLTRYERDSYKKEEDALNAFKVDHCVEDTCWNKFLETIRGLRQFHIADVREPFLLRENDKRIPAKLRAMITQELKKKGIHQGYLQLERNKQVTNITAVRSGVKFTEHEPYIMPSPGMLKINPSGFNRLSPDCQKGMCIVAVTLADPQVSVVYNVLQVFPSCGDDEITEKERLSLSYVYLRTAMQRCALRDQETAVALKAAYDHTFVGELDGLKFMNKIVTLWRKISYNEHLRAESMNDID